jgi:hypothetical protein
MIIIFHSPKNFRDTRSRPDNKIVCMLDLGIHATYILINLRTALADCQIVVLAVTDLSECKTAKEVANISAPDKNGLLEGSSVFIPAHVLCNAILASGKNDS